MSHDDCAECVFWMAALVASVTIVSASVILASLCLGV